MKSVSYDEVQWARRQYHNERIYWNFSFFVKVSMGVCAGFAYLAANEVKGNSLLIAEVIKLGSYLELMVGALCALNIASHYFAKNRIVPGNHPPFYKRVWRSSDLYMFVSSLVGAIIIWQYGLQSLSILVP